MRFTLLEADIVNDFDEIIQCQWSAYENPYQRFFRLFCPLRGDDPSARLESLEESTARQLDWHNTDPTSHWRKVVNDDGKIVGACLWKIYPTNPFEKVDDHCDASWHLEGETREYVVECLEQFDAPRRRMGARPQVYFRRQGIADLIMEWGKQKADEMGVEMWLDSTEYGVPLYKKHGFTVVNVNPLKPTKAAPGEAWKKIDEELQPMTFWQMWRPVGGDYGEGETVKPWE
ncbi:hypothetical protein FZEAL_872 [Fusarium zealandicum]|uniref:N-acetyltransferase domain-containing protein n=1 Tax=Fusarium zealandicum TaxID=1053134 RepID=A0A8H4UTW5_9HYPO|nr:hypothetical protein FZEAL_872 [Fusarium zealandicum]